MRLLLDTHFILAVLHPDLPLREPYRALLLNQDNQLFASVASLWEIAIKLRLGKLRLDVPLLEVPLALSDAECRIFEVTDSHVLAEVDPWPDTQDPFDRLLLAVCVVEGLALVTLDRELAGHPLAWKSASA